MPYSFASCRGYWVEGKGRIADYVVTTARYGVLGAPNFKPLALFEVLRGDCAGYVADFTN